MKTSLRIFILALFISVLLWGPGILRQIQYGQREWFFTDFFDYSLLLSAHSLSLVVISTLFLLTSALFLHSKNKEILGFYWVLPLIYVFLLLWEPMVSMHFKIQMLDSNMVNKLDYVIGMSIGKFLMFQLFYQGIFAYLFSASFFYYYRQSGYSDMEFMRFVKSSALILFSLFFIFPIIVYLASVFYMAGAFSGG